MADKKRPTAHPPQKKSSHVPLAPAKPSKSPAPSEQADGSPKPTDTRVARRADEAKAGAKGNQTAGNHDGPASSTLRSYNIPDYRLEHPEFRIFMSGEGSSVEYRVEGDLSAAAPPIRESKYLSREQCIAIYRWMLLNRRMEVALENLYKQGKVVGGVYFGLGQEGCSCASAYALGTDDWLGPMIRNQGAMLVRGFSARDIMRQYMAKGDSPTWGRDASSHFGDFQKRNVCAPISMLGELIGVMAGVCLGARLQGKNVAGLTYVGDGGQSTGVTYESLNFAAVQKLGLVLVVENNLWGYSTPADMQFLVKDLAERAIAYGIPGVIVDGTDPCQVYDATYEACERAHRGEGPTHHRSEDDAHERPRHSRCCPIRPSGAVRVLAAARSHRALRALPDQSKALADGRGQSEADRRRGARAGSRSRRGGRLADARSRNRQDTSRRLLRSVVP